MRRVPAPSDVVGLEGAEELSQGTKQRVLGTSETFPRGPGQGFLRLVVVRGAQPRAQALRCALTNSAGLRAASPGLTPPLLKPGPGGLQAKPPYGSLPQCQERCLMCYLLVKAHRPPAWAGFHDSHPLLM